MGSPASPTAGPPASPTLTVSSLPAALAAALIAALLVGVMLVGRPPAAAAVLVLQVSFAVGWLGLVGSSVGLGDLALVTAAAVAADVILLHSRHADPGSLAAVIGLSYVAALLRQLARRQRTDVTSALVATASGVALVCAPSVLLPLGAGDSGRAVAAAGLLGAAAALVLGALVDRVALLAVPGAAPAAGIAGLLLGIGVALAVGVAMAHTVAGGRALGDGDALGVAAASAVAALAARVAVSRAAPQGRVLGLHAVAAGLPVLVAVPVAYAAGRLLLG